MASPSSPDTGLHVVLRVIASFSLVSLFTMIATVQHHKQVKAKSAAVSEARRAADRAAGRWRGAPVSRFPPHRLHRC